MPERPTRDPEQRIIMTTINDEYTTPARIASIAWEVGAGAEGSTLELTTRLAPFRILWRGRATVQGIIAHNFDPKGLSAPDGFKVSQISQGTLVVYLR